MEGPSFREEDQQFSLDGYHEKMGSVVVGISKQDTRGWRGRKTEGGKCMCMSMNQVKAPVLNSYG